MDAEYDPAEHAVSVPRRMTARRLSSVRVLGGQKYAPTPIWALLTGMTNLLSAAI
jgi:hypothetical protein